MSENYTNSINQVIGTIQSEKNSNYLNTIYEKQQEKKRIITHYYYKHDKRM